MDAVIIFLASYLIFAIGLMAAFVAYKAKKRREFILALVIAGILALDLSILAGVLYYNPRPFVSQGIEPLISHSPDNGFPSQHTVIAMALTSVIYFSRRQIGAVALVLTFLVGAGRVWAHVHSWTDILGGLLIGATAGYVGVILARYLLTKFGPSERSASGRAARAADSFHARRDEKPRRGVS
ncbi:phosphatase PAP2 family protein [Candidatus Saccharibacteria bacterium]|nr:phosphatase PAP2 family protein [Candidatus Saccharibacteria bacterium]